MIMLILFQSFSAVANTLEYHSSDLQHLSEVHEHAIDDKAVTAKVPSQSQSNVQLITDNIFSANNHHNPADCHHCGHCHGSHAQWLEHTADIQLNIAQINPAFYYRSQLVASAITQLLRPPKA